MSNLMQRSASFLMDKLKSSGGRAATYRRGNGSVSLTSGVPAMQEYKTVNEKGFPTRVTSLDWILEASDLVINGEVIEPQKGDTITETLNGATHTYMVVPIGEDLPCFSALDNGDEMLLVHTKRVAKA